MNNFFRPYSIGLLAFTLLLVLGFQNCSPALQSQDLTSVFALKGNGGGYEGKPEVYYRYIAGYKCEGQPSALQRTEIINGTGIVYDLKAGQCGGVGTPLQQAQIDISPLQNDFISVNDILFKRYDEKPQGIPNSLAEVLCRDNFENPSFEIISHFDTEKNQAVTRVYSKNTVVPDFGVSRLLSIDNVRYVSQKLSYKIDFSKTSASGQRFIGQIESTSVDLLTQPNQQTQLTCIIGGHLDISQVMVKPLISDTALEPLLMTNGDVIFTGKISAAKNTSAYDYGIQYDGLFKVSKNAIPINVIRGFFGEGAQYSQKIEDVTKNRLIVRLNEAGKKHGSDYVFNPITNSFKQITNLPGSSLEEFAHTAPAPHFVDQRHLIFRLAKQAEGMNFILRHFDEKTNELIDILTSENADLIFKVFPESKTVFIARGVATAQEDNWVYDMTTKTLRQIKIALPSNCLMGDVTTTILQDGTSFARSLICDVDPLDTKKLEAWLALISIQDGSVKILEKRRQIIWSSPLTNWILTGDRAVISDGTLTEYIDALTPKRPWLYNIETGQSLSSPIIPRFGSFDGARYLYQDPTKAKFYQENTAEKIAFLGDNLYGFGGVIEAPTLFAVNTRTGGQSKVCEDADGQKILLTQLENKKIYLMTHDFKLSIFRFYLVKSPAECIRLNEFPGSHTSFTSLMAVKDGFVLGLGDKSSPYFWESNATDGYYIPGDGRPPVRLNNQFYRLKSIKVSPDKDRILFEGVDAQGGRKINILDLP